MGGVLSTLSGLIIDRIRTFAVGLPTLRSFDVSGGAVTVAGKPSMRVLVKVSADGVHGWGEVTPLPSWAYETTESIVSTIRPLPRRPPYSASPAGARTGNAGGMLWDRRRAERIRLDWVVGGQGVEQVADSVA
ncbi:enolase-like domain-containing protein [Amycolatopsis aidingensis]|uniref:hypothetical protein n=1 Tax=Amycolatopsis aidingensis TaxID=2842453 RepID=UPI001C0E6752|nr:hypothetical protein [Amycolatopsis aidingensis]